MAEWVRAPTEITSAGGGVGAELSVMPPDASTRTAARRVRPGHATLGRHVRGPCCRGARLRRPPGAASPPARLVALDLHHAPGPQGRARATASAMVTPPRWLSFTSTASDRLARWLSPPPARTAAFSQGPQSRGGLAGVEDPHPRVAGATAAT